MSYSAELLKTANSNTQLRFFQGDNCMVIQVHGPFLIQNLKASQQAILDIQIKYTQDVAQQRVLEFELKQLFEQILSLSEYPSQMIRVVIVVQQAKGSLFASLANGIQLALMHQGINAKRSIHSVDVGDQNVTVDLFTNRVVHLMSGPLTRTEYAHLIAEATQQTLAQQQWLKSYFYEHYDKYNIV